MKEMILVNTTGSSETYHRAHRALPEGSELVHLRKTMTLAAIGERYGVSRQAVHKAIMSWQAKQVLADAA